MTRFTWTDADRAKLVPGASVVVHWLSGNTDRGVVESGPSLHGTVTFVGDAFCHVSQCDPASIRPPKQLDLFGGEK